MAKPEAVPERSRLLRETLLFDWKKWNPPVAWHSMPAIALSLGLGIGLGSPESGLVAAAGAFTTGLGALQTIRGSCTIPMLLAAAGVTLSTFVGMVVGHQSVAFLVVSGLWAAIYALLTALKGGTSWVGLQCAVFLLVSSAFHTSPRGALTRCSLILGGGLLQTLFMMAIRRWARSGYCPEEPAAGPPLWKSLGGVRGCAMLRTPVCRYSLRMTLVVAGAAEIYRYTNFSNGYWIPMTALLVVRPDFVQTLTRGVMRVAGTLLGVWMAGLIAAHLHPSPAMLGGLIVFFAWWAYSLLSVNYALFTLNLTAYIVFLLALAGIPEAAVVHRRAAFTLLGGGLALLAYVDLFRRTGRWIRAERQRAASEQSAR
jgi:hypothetical protein